MKAVQSDEQISKHLDSFLTPALSQSHKCISNSIVLPSQQGAYLAYFAKNQDRNLLLIAINVSIDQGKQSIKTFPVQTDSPGLIQDSVLEFSQCSYIPGTFAILNFDPREKALQEKKIFLATISIDDLLKTKSQKLQLYNIDPSRKIGTIKHVQWHQFAPMTLLILTDSKLLAYDLMQNAYEASFEVNLKDLQVANLSEVTKRDQFQKIGFAQKINQQDRYSSFGKKLSLYLASNTGAIYLLFPFVPQRLILDESEAQAFEVLKKLSISSRKQERAERMAKFFQTSQLGLVKQQKEQEPKGKEYDLRTDRPFRIKPEIFKLTLANQHKASSTTMTGSCQKIQIFKPVTLGCHTLFLIGTRLKNQQYDFKTMVFAEDPYQTLLQKSTYARTQNFNIEIVGEIKLEKTTENNQLVYGNTLQLLVPKAIENTQIYLTHNNMTCYRISLFGLEKFLKNPLEEINDLRLIDVDVVFDSQHKLLTLALNDINVFVLRNSNQTYLFESIPIRSLELKQKINKTIQETQELFKKLAAKPKHLTQSKPQKNIDLQEIKSTPLVQIEQKLKQFSEDYRKSVQQKLKKVKDLYENIQSKNQQLKKQQNQKAEMIKLVNQAQQNQRKIKDMFANEKKNFTSKAEENIKRRIQATSDLLDQIKERIETEREEVKNDPQKIELMEECEGQADGVIEKLQDLKSQLIAKRNQLREELGLPKNV